MEGVYTANCDFSTDLAWIEFDPTKVSAGALIEKIESLGYGASKSIEKMPRSDLLTRFVVAAFLTLQLMMLAIPLYVEALQGWAVFFAWISLFFSLPLLIYPAWPIVRSALTSWRAKKLSMETFILMGVGAAFALSILHLWQGDLYALYFESMGMVITFVLLGKWLEQRAKKHACQSMRQLLRHCPQKARLQTSEGVKVVALSSLRVRDHLLASSKEKIAIDGRVLSGEAWVDESLMTGELLPQKKVAGSRLLAGTIVTRGSITYEVTRPFKESLLAHILSVIEEDLVKKPRLHLGLDRLAAILIPSVLILALLVGFMNGIEAMIATLLVACPCAIGMALPLARSLLIQAFAVKGVMVRKAEALSSLSFSSHLLLDKTGTLTKGSLSLRRGGHELDQEEQEILGALAAESEHPISQALATGSRAFEKVQEQPGEGIEAMYQGASYKLGSASFIGVKSEPLPPWTEVCFSKEGVLLTRLYLGDQLRTQFSMRRFPFASVRLLSGDHPEVTRFFANAARIDQWQGGMTPLEKKKEVQRLQQNAHVIMVGDGINDAAALSAADVGIAVSRATEFSRQAADLILTKSGVELLPELVKLRSRGEKIGRQNLVWAFAYNVVALPMAACGLITPILAALAMASSSLFVTLNSCRLLKSSSQPSAKH